MADTPTRFPLAWPAGRPRTPAGRRRAGAFSYKADSEHGSGWRATKEITVERAMDRLEAEVSRLGGRNTLLSSNLDTRLDGRPRSGAANPADPGVCLYFSLAGEPMAMACDAYTKVAQNIAALAAHIEATRAIERHGVATAAETLQAFRALPPPDKPKRPWPEVFGVMEGAATAETIDALYKVMAKKRHPDVPGGSEEAMAELNEARTAAMKALGAGTQLETTQ